MRDRALQAVYQQALDPVAETLADPDSYGFRKARGCADALEQCFCLLARRSAPQWVLEGDIEACFDRIDHDWLVQHVPLTRSPLRAWLKAGYLERHVLHPTHEGTPQGGIISPVLANLALDGLEAELAAAFPPHRKPEQNPKVHLVRYADDFVVTGNTRELLETQVRPRVEAFLAQRGLRLSPQKTVITHIRDGFDFLGQNVRKYPHRRHGEDQGKLLIKPAPERVRLFLEDLRKFVKGHKQAETAWLIRKLNEKIRGWANYHRHAVSQATFGRVDAQLFRLLWQWARRRHPKKSRAWVRNHYFTTHGGNHWVFFGIEAGRRGEARRVTLYAASRTRIMRHVKVRRAVNPYDPQWRPYLEERQRKLALRSRSTAGSWDHPARETAAQLHSLAREESPSGPPDNSAGPRPSRGVRRA